MKKRYFLLLMFILMIALLSGCGNLNMKHKNEDKTTTTVTAQGSMVLARCPKFDMDKSYGIRMRFNGITQFYISILYGEELERYSDMDPIAESSNLTVYIDYDDDFFPYHYIMDIDGTDDSYILFKSWEGPDNHSTLATDFEGMLTYTVNDTETVPDVKGLKVLRDFERPGTYMDYYYDDYDDVSAAETDDTSSEDDTSVEKENDPSITETADGRDVYDVIIENCITLLTDDDALFENGADNWIFDVKSVSYTDGDPLYYAGYAIEDITGDGVEELIIASTDPSDPHTGSLIYAVYTKNGDEAVKIVDGWGRNRHYFSNAAERDGNAKVFYCESSSGAADTQFGLYFFNANGKVKTWIDYYYTVLKNNGETEYYTNTTGLIDPNPGDFIIDQENAFYNAMNSYQDSIESFPVTPLYEFE